MTNEQLAKRLTDDELISINLLNEASRRLREIDDLFAELYLALYQGDIITALDLFDEFAANHPYDPTYL